MFWPLFPMTRLKCRLERSNQNDCMHRLTRFRLTVLLSKEKKEGTFTGLEVNSQGVKEEWKWMKGDFSARRNMEARTKAESKLRNTCRWLFWEQVRLGIQPRRVRWRWHLFFFCCFFFAEKKMQNEKTVQHPSIFGAGEKLRRAYPQASPLKRAGAVRRFFFFFFGPCLSLSLPTSAPLPRGRDSVEK